MRHVSLISTLLGIFIGYFVGSQIVHDLNSEDEFMYDNRSQPQNHKLDHVHEESAVQKDLYKEVRVLCWIMSNPKNLKKQKAVFETWGKRCNKFLIMSSEKAENLPVVALPVKEGRKNLWAKTKEAFKYVYKNHLDDADWFLKADDDTYVILENLRAFLYQHDTNDPIYFGCHLKGKVEQGFNSGGAGYVLSKEALKRFIKEALPNSEKCRKHPNGAEDVTMGKCLQNVGVKVGDTRDKEGKSRFLPMKPNTHMFPKHNNFDKWYYLHSFHPTTEGLNCCSEETISFHYIPPLKMYGLEYLIYHLKPYGVQPYYELPEKIKKN
ncbi:glycoprotein-N-acetylgalactosamine 3-beta-galactosyltransferase 1-like [Culicoides brevitarsis]|uniref:glycoprotein-N-acetylgalactosamine 3-beta-galactosyltransferase 1-like n=1 Tax=Culicoides brevitarsis TaxID=469753 RepID=UPI00307C1872